MHVQQIINSFFSSNSFILYNDSPAAYLIDCGDTHEITSWLSTVNKTLLAVFLTHTHFDHIYGLNDLLNKNEDIQVYTSEFGREALFNDRKNLSFYHEKSFTFKGDNVSVLKNNEFIELWPGTKLKAYETIGHDKSCLTFYVDEYLFTGDSYIPDINVITTLPNSDKMEAKKSRQFILSLINNKTILCPGHGNIHKYE